ncbi:MAG: hypothetical protein QOI12_159 [Alphaproteobacteria bacterium]|nr:hypothetical protein [Alphaproteobacteria bacterium]
MRWVRSDPVAVAWRDSDSAAHAAAENIFMSPARMPADRALQLQVIDLCEVALEDKFRLARKHYAPETLDRERSTLAHEVEQAWGFVAVSRPSLMDWTDILEKGEQRGLMLTRERSIDLRAAQRA